MTHHAATDEDRPTPEGRAAHAHTDDAPSADTGDGAGRETGDAARGADGAELTYGTEDDGQEYVDRSKIDFDPADGLYSGTAVDGTTDIPGPHDEDGDEESVAKRAAEIAEQEGTAGQGDPQAAIRSSEGHASDGED